MALEQSDRPRVKVDLQLNDLSEAQLPQETEPEPQYSPLALGQPEESGNHVSVAGFYPYDIVPILGACVTMQDGFIVLGNSGKRIPASQEAVQRRKEWLMLASAGERRRNNKSRKQNYGRGSIITTQNQEWKSKRPEHYVPPRVPETEEALFASTKKSDTGQFIDDFMELSMTSTYLGPGKELVPASVQSAAELLLPQSIYRNCLSLGITDLLPIQRQAIPMIDLGYDVIGTSPTGTGKTAAFLIPIIRAIVLAKARSAVHARPVFQAMILCPTRELACQIQKTAAQLSYLTNVTSFALYGAIDAEHIRRSLEKGFDIIVATPGRMMEVITKKMVKVQSLRYVVVDEVDTMLAARSFPEVTAILASNAFPSVNKRQTLFFSATIPTYQLGFLKRHQYKPFSVLIGHTGPLPFVKQSFENTRGFHEKVFQLRKYLDIASTEQKTVIVFGGQKETVNSLAMEALSGYRHVVIHSGFTQTQREADLRRFVSGEATVLVASDLCSRGLDIAEIGLIINFNVPKTVEDYIHRVGRTGRKGHGGAAVTFYDSMRRTDTKAIGPLVAVLKDCGVTVDRWVEEEAGKHGGVIPDDWLPRSSENNDVNDLADVGTFLTPGTVPLFRYQWLPT